MFEYGSVTVSANGAQETSYALSSARFGANLRLMTPGKTVRFVGDIGGGFTHDSFHLETTDPKNNEMCGPGRPCGELTACMDASCGGFNAFLLGELGLEVDINGVLIGAALQNYFQSIRGIDNKPFGTDALFFFGGGLRIGYAAW